MLLEGEIDNQNGNYCLLDRDLIEQFQLLEYGINMNGNEELILTRMRN